MRAKRLLILAAMPLVAVAAHAEINVGAGLSYEAGNSPLSPVLPLVFVQDVYRIGPWQVFGLDLVVATAPVHSDTFANSGMSAGPEVFFGADASYHFPQVGPAEFALLLGGCGFQDYENRVNGSAAHAGAEITLRWGNFFVQGRGLYRFFTSANGEPIPLGQYSVAIMGGYVLSTPL